MSTVQFTALIRLPFSRGDFVDPQQASWDATKDRQLWKIISKSSKTSDLNWAELADYFHVPPAFLLQQAAWLYERHLDHVRAQMKKVGSATDSTHATIGGVPMKRGGSGGSGASRAPSTLSAPARDSPVPRGESSTPAPPLSRTPSTNTITQSRAYPPQPSIRNQPLRYRQKLSSDRADQLTINSPSSENTQDPLDTNSPSAPLSSSSSSSPSNSDDDNPARRSQLFKRPPRFRSQRQREVSAYDDAIDEGEEHGPGADTNLPFANASGPSKVLMKTKELHRGALSPKARQGRHVETSSDSRVPNTRSKTDQMSAGVDASSSLASSASDAPKMSPKSPGPLSPNHRSELARLSPRKSGLRARRDGSEGTPSMGSSFSDIDDASISQSALEEALLSNIQHGRMSTLSQLRSRYL